MRLLSKRLPNAGGSDSEATFGTSQYIPSEGNSANAQLNNTASVSSNTSRSGSKTQKEVKSYRQYRESIQIDSKSMQRTRRRDKFKSIKKPVIPTSLREKQNREKRMQVGEESPLI